MSQHPVVIVEKTKKALLALLELRLASPRVNQRVGTVVIDTAVGATVKGDKQQCLRLLGLDQRQKG